jgi:hypothetical protein
MAVISCEKDFKNIGTDIVDDNIFNNNKYSAQIKGYSVRITSNKTNTMSYYLLGYNENAPFGTLTASIATQLSLPEVNPDWGDNALLDSVVITIPYESRPDGKQDAPGPNGSTIRVPNYKLDSVFTSGDGKNFNLNIYELGTYLNELDPTNPEVANEFFSDKVYLKTGSPLYSGTISPNRNDTMMVIKRQRYANNSLTEIYTDYTKDTIKLENAKPALRIPLDKQKIKQLFKDNDIANSFNFSSQSNFNHYFRGLYFEATNSGNGTALAYLHLDSAYMTIFYTESQIDSEEQDEDLNGNQVLGEQNIIVAHKKSFQYSFSGIKANVYERNHSGNEIENYLNNPNTVSGDDKLFVHGAAGSDAVIHLFGDDLDSDNVPDEIETLRNNNWLITDAKLYFYIDSPNSSSHYPSRLYLYRIENSEKYQIYDVTKHGSGMVSGDLVYDDDNHPDYYLFHITDYVSEILKENDGVKITDFGLKVYDPYDEFNFLKPNDTIMKKYNNQFKGVVLKGKNSVPTPKDLKFEIFYTEKNN